MDNKEKSLEERSTHYPSHNDKDNKKEVPKMSEIPTDGQAGNPPYPGEKVDNAADKSKKEG